MAGGSPFHVKEVFQRLSESIEEMNLHGLKLSAKWLSEHLLGLDQLSYQQELSESATGSLDPVPLYSNQTLVPRQEKEMIHFANLLLVANEFQRCAHFLRTKYENKTLTSQLGIFLLTYSLFLAGEKIKEQNLVEASGEICLLVSSHCLNTGNQTTNKERNPEKKVQESVSLPMNPFLNEIFHILYPIYVSSCASSSTSSSSHALDGDSMNQSEEEGDPSDDHASPAQQHGMDGYLYYIFGIVVRELRQCGQSAIGDLIHEMREVNDQVVSVIPHAYELLFKAVELNPYNW
jgi:hypothetical protein